MNNEYHTQMDRNHFQEIIAHTEDWDLVPHYFLRKEYNPLYIEELLSAIEHRPQLKTALEYADSLPNDYSTESKVYAARCKLREMQGLPPYDEPVDTPLPVDEEGPASLNGCGTRYAGKYDIDGNVYSTTLWLSLFFIPIIPLKAYRLSVCKRKIEFLSVTTEYTVHRKLKISFIQVIRVYLRVVLIFLIIYYALNYA